MSAPSPIAAQLAPRAESKEIDNDTVEAKPALPRHSKSITFKEKITTLDAALYRAALYLEEIQPRPLAHLGE